MQSVLFPHFRVKQLPLEFVQDENFVRSTHVAQPFVAKCCVQVIFWIFNTVNTEK